MSASTSLSLSEYGTIHAIVALVSFFCGVLGELLFACALRRDLNVHPSLHWNPFLASESASECD